MRETTPNEAPLQTGPGPNDGDTMPQNRELNLETRDGVSTPGAAFERLAAIVARLRAPDGCPWDRVQTHSTLRPYLLEETAEVVDAIERDDMRHLCEELGDLTLQPVLHAQIAAEAGNFTVVDVLNEISDKLIRRHPHVFGQTQADNPDTVVANWDAIKKAEKEARGQQVTSILDEQPAELPALSLALKVSKKAAKVGFEWPDFEGVLAKMKEEVEELEEALEEVTPERAAEELGDLLFTAVNVARWKGINPELALRDQVRRFRTRFQHMENAAREKGLELTSLSPSEWDTLWNAAKKAT